jgi:metal transporter CNNM
MPVFLEKLVPPYLAILLSVTLVLIFGEIIPSALFTGKNQILLASKLSSFVWLLLYVLYPITFPISKVLDCIFGHEDEQSLSRNELEALVILQNAACRQEYDQVGTSHDTASLPSELSRDEIDIMTGVLRLSQLTALDAMIPVDKVSMISSNVVLDEAALEKIMTVGFSRYPVFEEKDRGFILGYLLVKKLIVVNPTEKKKVTSLELLEPIVVHPSEDLFEMLNIFQVQLVINKYKQTKLTNDDCFPLSPPY